MKQWLILWKAEALLMAVMVVGCSSTPPSLRPPEIGAGGEILIHIPHTATVEPVEVNPEEVRRAIRRLAREVRLSGSPRETVERLFQLDALYGDYLYLRQERKLIPTDSGTPLEGGLAEAEQRWTNWYKQWCRSAHGFEGDCLGGALMGGKYLDMRGRYMWAMALSKSPVLEEFEKALGEMVSMRAVMQAAMYTLVVLLVLLTMPEPVTKFIAAWATTALILWVGDKTLYNLVTGWFQLMKEVKAATTFEEIREEGEKFGRLFSREAAQAFAMIAMALLTHAAKGFAEQVATLPGSPQVSMQTAGREGVLLSEVGAVESVTVTSEGFLVALPPGAVAMAAQGGGRGSRVENHHIGTIANKKSSLRGGPWTQRFEELFARAGMRLQDAENIVPIHGTGGLTRSCTMKSSTGAAERAPGDVQLIPVDIEGHPEQYVVLVATRLLRCIDEQASRILLWTHEDGEPDRVGQYRDVRDMRIDKAKVGNAKVFRPDGWEVVLIVSEEIKDAMEAMGTTGTRFQGV